MNINKLQSRHIGLLVVVFALLVTAPRLTLTFIMSDNLRLNETVEFWTLVISAIAGSVVLTLGNAYLTHVLAERFDRHDALSWLLSAAWVLYLCFTTAIIAPALMVGVRHSPLAEVLPHPALQWIWCVIAALCFEFLVAGSMAGYAIASRVMPITSNTIPTDAITQSAGDAPEKTEPVTQPSARQRAFALLDEHNGDIGDAAIASQVGIDNARTISGYRSQWRKQRLAAISA